MKPKLGAPEPLGQNHRLAQGLQLGGALLRDAVLRCTRAAQDASVRALLVYGLHDRAAQFSCRVFRCGRSSLAPG